MISRPYKGRHGRRAPSVSAVPKAYNPILQLWILRLIQLGGGLFGERRNRSDISPDAIEAAGLPPMHGRMRDNDPAQVAAVEATFRAALQAAEEAAPALPQTTPIAQNIEWLGEAAGLGVGATAAQAGDDGINELLDARTLRIQIHTPGRDALLEQCCTRPIEA